MTGRVYLALLLLIPAGVALDEGLTQEQIKEEVALAGYCDGPSVDDAFDEASFLSDAEEYVSCVEEVGVADQSVDEARIEMQEAYQQVIENTQEEREAIECEQSWFC